MCELVYGKGEERVIKVMSNVKCRWSKGTIKSKEGSIDTFWIELNIKSRDFFFGVFNWIKLKKAIESI